MMSLTRHRALLLTSTAIVLAGAISPAMAAEAAATNTGADASSANTVVEEVLITARKRSERLLDVPVAATALDAKALEKYATYDMNSIGLLVPQVAIDQAPSGNGAIITIRGIGSTSVDAAIEQEVTVNIDGVPISRGRVIGQATFDEASVEILKGPQSLYFGKNSPAGVISITSQGPGGTFGGYARAGYEFGAREYYAEGAIGGPLGNGWSARLALRASKMDGGWVKGIGLPISGAGEPYFLRKAGIPTTGSPFSAYPGDKDLIGRATIVFKPDGSPFDATFKFLGSDHHDRGDSMATVIYHCAPGHTSASSLDFGAFLDPTHTSPVYLSDPSGGCGGKRSNSYGGYPAQVASGYPGSNGGVPFTDVVSYLSSLTMNYKILPDLILTSVTGYYDYNEQQFSNYDETSMIMASGVNNDQQTSLSEELRLQSSFKSPLNFTLGGFYGHDRRSFHQAGSIGFLGFDQATGKTDLFESIDYYSTDTFSVFGEASLKLGHNVELAGGARYTSEHKNGDVGQTYVHPLLRLLIPQIAAPVGTRFISEINNNNISPQVTLSWHASPNVMVYGAYKTGFKSGGISTPAIIPASATTENQKFKPESAEGEEIGAKFSVMDRRLNGDLSLYNYTYSDLQLTQFNAATTSYFTQNAASATTKGVELNLAFQATRELNLHTGIGYSHARYDKFTGAQCYTGQVCGPTGQDLSGQPLSRAPDWSAMAGANYDIQLKGDWRVGATADVRYNSGYQLQSNNNPDSVQKEFATFDASVRAYDGKWEVALIGQNLTDTYYAVLAGDKPLGLAGDILAALGKPRQVTLQITRHF